MAEEPLVAERDRGASREESARLAEAVFFH
jgi:hypothetical protein